MIISGFASALRTLTIIPAPGPEPEAQKRYMALPFFCLVGGGLGLVQYFLAESIAHYVIEVKALIGLLLAAINYIVSGGMHLDGLADSADAFCTPHSRERTLAILKDPHIGTFGVVAVFFAVAWRTAVYQQLFVYGILLWIVFALSASRIIQGILLQILPYSRGSEGKAFGYKGPSWVAACLFAQLAGIETAVWFIYGAQAALASIMCGIAAVLPVVIVYLRRIGGFTGDGIGAVTELFEIAFLTGAIICLN